MTTKLTFGRPLLGLVFFAVLLALPLSAGRAQETSDHHSHSEKPYALIFCTVWDKTDMPAYGVKVTLRRTDQKKASWVQYSNHSGEAAFRVPAGKADYILTADVKPSKGKGKPTTTAYVENEERVDVGLHLTE